MVRAAPTAGRETEKRGVVRKPVGVHGPLLLGCWPGQAPQGSSERRAVPVTGCPGDDEKIRKLTGSRSYEALTRAPGVRLMPLVLLPRQVWMAASEEWRRSPASPLIASRAVHSRSAQVGDCLSGVRSICHGGCGLSIAGVDSAGSRCRFPVWVVVRQCRPRAWSRAIPRRPCQTTREPQGSLLPAPHGQTEARWPKPQPQSGVARHCSAPPCVDVRGWSIQVKSAQS